MKRLGKLRNLVASVALGASMLQVSNCNSDVANIVINATNQATQLLAGAAIDAFFFSLGDSNLSGGGGV